MDVLALWQAGVAEELAFWRSVAFATEGLMLDYRGELHRRCDPASELASWFAAAITTGPVTSACIVDLGAGPASLLGWHWHGRPLNIIPIDPLADDYAVIMREAGFTVPVATRKGRAEELDSLLPPESVDLIHMRNALDHCIDPLRVIAAAAAVLKPDGLFWIDSFRNEGEWAKYQGLHQWNLDAEDGRMVLWRPGVRTDIGAAFPGLAIETARRDHLLEFRLRKQG